MSQHSKLAIRVSVRSRRRRGGVMLLCMLAAVVVATAVLGLAQSHRHRIMRIDSRRATIQATQASSGLYQRAITVIQNNSTFSGRLDPVVKTPLGNYAFIQPLTATETAIEVYAYDKAVVPVIKVVVDPTAL